MTKRTETWGTGFVDLAGGQGLLGPVDGPTSTAVRSWLEQRCHAFRDAIEVMVIDPHAATGRPPKARTDSSNR